MTAPEEAEETEPGAPLASAAQESIWLMEQLRGDGSPYHLPLVLELNGELSVSALEQALAGLVARHQMLASVVTQRSGELLIVAAAQAPALAVTNLSQVPGAEQDELLGRLTREEIGRPFDLDLGPLLRARLFTLGNGRHRLLAVAHHLVFDGASKDIFVRDLVQLYRACEQGTQPALPPVTTSYAACAAAERARIARSRDDARRFWQRRWHGPGAVFLPGEQWRGQGWTTAGEARDFTLDATFSKRLDGAAASLDATRFQLLLTVLHCLLVRYGNDSPVVATDFSTRTARARHVIGVFVNELPVMADLTPELTFRQAARKVGASLREVSGNRFVPLGQALGGEAAAQHVPVSVSYRHRRAGRMTAPAVAGLQMTVNWTMFAPVVRKELHLQLVDSTHEIAASIRYPKGALTSDGAARVAEQFTEFAGAAIDDPARRVADLPLLAGRERRQVLFGWNQTSAHHNGAQTLTAMLERQAERSPGAIAVQYGPDQLTYAQLHRRASQLASQLRAAGVGPEVRVGVCAQRSAELVVGLLAVLKAGGAFLPLDPDYPAERLAFMLNDAAPRVVLTQQHLRRRLPRAAVTTMLLGDEARHAPAAPLSYPARGLAPGNAAYVIYTSGSTGTPKGVINTHRGLCNRLEWMQERFRLDASDAVLQKTPIGFDVCVWEFFWPLLAGARLVLAGPGGHRDPAYLRRIIAEQSITTLHFVPSMLAAFLASGSPAGNLPVRRTICSGEELPVTVARRFFEQMPGELHNLYGPAEAAIDVSAWHCLPADLASAARVPIGRPISNTALYVLDPRLEPAPIGIPGELHIGGVPLGRGYLNRPGLTADRFVPDPFGVPGSRLYKTGDRARLRADGNLEFLGRLDSQVKISGVRAEPGEIESALRQQPGVADAAVAVQEHPGQGKRLIGYVVTEHGAPVDVAGLRSALGRWLPDQMIPARFVALPALPLNANGKLDRSALPGPAAVESRRGIVAPRTATERLVATVWAQVLRAGPVSIEDNFFEAGGSSILGAQVMGRLSTSLDRELPLRLLFDHPTIRGLAQALGAPPAGPAAAIPPEPGPARPMAAGQGGGPEEAPASLLQEEHWQREQRGAPTRAGISVAYHLRGPLDGPALERSLAYLVQRHEPLRTTFAQRGAEVIQRIWPGVAVSLPRSDLRELPAAQRVAVADLELIAAADAAFDLHHGPVLRGKLIRLAEAEHIFFLSAHHIVTDDWSMRVIADELGALYSAFRRGQPAPLAPLPLRYRDYATWHRSRVSERLGDNLRYWARQLADLPSPPRFPGGRDRGQVQDYQRTRHVFSLSQDATCSLGRVSNAAGATTFLGFLAAFNMCLAAITGSEDLVTASLFPGRDRPGFEHLVGLLPNLTVLRASLAGDPAFGEVLCRVRDAALDAHEHQDLPFRKYARELGLGAPADLRLPVWDTWVNATSSRRSAFGIVHDLRMDGLAVSDYSPRPGRGYHRDAAIWEGDNLSLTIAGDANDRQLVLDYNARLFSAADTDRFSRSLISVVGRVGAAPGTSLSALRRLLA